MGAQQVEWKENGETFVLGTRQYDVDQAKRILAGRKRVRVQDVDITDAFRFLSEPGDFRLGIMVNWQRVQQSPEVDESVPLILVSHEDGMVFPIDGWHRIAKAKLRNRTRLPGVVLSRRDSRRIRR